MQPIRTRAGQAILEYLLLVMMLAVTMAVVIRNTNFTIYCFWSGLAMQVAIACPDCTGERPPQADECSGITSTAEGRPN